jgi:predicted RNA-binding Zn ribbon-like protein
LLAAVYAERFWKLAIKRLRGRFVSDELFLRTSKLANISNPPVTLSLPELIQCLISARQSHKALQKDSHTLRQNYLTGLAEALVLKRAPYLGTDPKYNEKLTNRTAKEVKRLIRLEHKRHLYRLIGRQLGDKHTNGGGLA